MTSMEADIARLGVVLHAEEELYLRLRSVLRREESELIELDAKVIEETVEEKRALAEEGRLLEESRLAITAEISRALGLGDGPVRLSDLIETLGPEAGVLPELHARLLALIASNRALLDANEGFASRSLGRVQETLRLLGRSVPEESGYGPRSRSQPGTGRGRLVRQAI
ncbi:MAG: flagellar protein FlgN [bacterium]